MGWEIDHAISRFSVHTANIFCVDHSYSRLQRLKDVLRWYTPKAFHDDGMVQTFHGNGVQFCRSVDMKFDKVGRLNFVFNLLVNDRIQY